MALLQYSPVADPDLELRGCGEGGGRGSSVLIALPAFLPFCISSFQTQKKGGGGQPPQAPPLDLPLFTTVL